MSGNKKYIFIPFIFIVLLLSGALPTYAYTPPPYVKTIFGTGEHGSTNGNAYEANFNLPANIFLGKDTIFVVDTFNNMIRKISQENMVYTFAGRILAYNDFGFPHGFYWNDNLETALFNRPMDGIEDKYGRVFITDSGNNAIRMIENGQVTTFAGGQYHGYTNGPGDTALFNFPTAITLGPCGNLFVADTLNHAIRKIDTTTRNVTTVAGLGGVYGHTDGHIRYALFDSPMGIAVDDKGRIFVSDTDNNVIRLVENDRVTTIAGTPPGEYTYPLDPIGTGGFADGPRAMFNQPTAIALWGDKIIVADTANNRIRLVLPQGEVLTLAGIGYPGHLDDLPMYTYFHLPMGVYISEDVLFITDTGNNMIRKLILEENIKKEG